MRKNKHKITLFAAILLLFGFLNAQNVYSQPEYAKWGSLAMQETAKRYPGYQIVDYLHVGRTEINPEVAQETFKLWLKRVPRKVDGRKEFGVYVKITFRTKNDQVINIDFEETER